MTGWSLIIAAGLVNWLGTTLVVDSELVRPLRDLAYRRRCPEGPIGVDAFGKRWAQVSPDRFERVDRQPWRWLDYLLRCHLCTGIWVAIAEVLYLGALVGALVGRGVAGYVFTVLLVKAVGHLVLELRPQAWRAPADE